jgi:tripartite-type tricarboxylate transporter receptor subunit TctC
MGRSLVVTLLVAGLAALGLALPRDAAAADTYPTRTIRMIVPFPPGGPTDLVSRVLAETMSADLGQPIVVDNRPGANGNVGAEAVAKAEGDGYTILYNTSAVAISPALYPKLGYDLRKDLVPVCLTATVPLVLVMNPGIPAKTVQDFIAYVKANPGKLSYASTGIGSVTHLGAVLFMQLAGLEAVHVPFRGSAPALTAMAGNHVQFMTDTVNSAYPLINGGQLRGLAVLGTKRVDVVPDLPTLAEAGMKDFEIGAWQGIMAPAGTPPAVIDRLNASAVKALASPAVKEKLAIQGAAILGSTPAGYRDYIEAELVRWAAVVKESGAKAE